MNRARCALLIDIALEAGDQILRVYRDHNYSVAIKDDDSPVTTADHLSHEIIDQRLREHFPNIPILSEEAPCPAYNARRQWQEYFLVDPLDGTKEFVKGRGEFTVNIGYVVQDRPVAGVVFAPVLKELFYTLDGQHAYMKSGEARDQPISVRACPSKTMKAYVSRSHSDAQEAVLKQHLKDIEVFPLGSSLKICRVAAGMADFYIRKGRTHEWDTAAAHAILLAAGGNILQKNAQPLAYNKPKIVHPSFVCMSQPNQLSDLLLPLL